MAATVAPRHLALPSPRAWIGGSRRVRDEHRSVAGVALEGVPLPLTRAASSMKSYRPRPCRPRGTP